MSICTKSSRNITYYYNPDAAPFDESLYHESVTNAASDSVPISGSASGRGPVQYRQHHGIPVVIKHYRRGGLIRHFSKDLYWFSGFEQSRLARELRLLDRMTKWGLPVPLPVAGRVVRVAGCWCRADLVTQQIIAKGSVANLLRSGGMSDTLWQSLALTLNRFHQHGVYHADLNAGNILLDEQGRFSLIDFDSGRVCTTAKDKKKWSIVSRDRLKRSLLKLCAADPAFEFDESWWDIVLAHTEF